MSGHLVGLRRGAPFAVSGVVLVAGLALAPHPDLTGVRLAPLAASTMLVGLAAVVLCGLRWRLFLPADWSASRAVRRYGEALFAGLFLPLGSDVYRAVAGRAEAQATVVDRLVAGVVTVAAAAAAVPFAGDLWPLPVVPPAAAAALALVGGVVGGFALLRSRRASGRRVAAAAAMTVTYMACLAVCLVLTGAAVGARLPLVAVAVAAPAILLGAAVPNVFGLSPGVAAVAWLLPATTAAVDADQAMAIALLLVAELWVVGLVGGVLLALRKVGR